MSRGLLFALSSVASDVRERGKWMALRTWDQGETWRFKPNGDWSSAQFSNWAEGEPNPDENCAVMAAGGGWEGRSCSSEAVCVCEILIGDFPPAPPPPEDFSMVGVGVGAGVGGAIGVGILLALAWWCCRRRRRGKAEQVWGVWTGQQGGPNTDSIDPSVQIT